MNKDNKYIVFLDADSFGNENIILRSRKDGDRFQPLGMDKGSIKISDFFINEKLEKSARNKWPLLVNSSEEIIWIPGFKPGNKFRIKKSTSRVIQFSISKTDD
jgi:tRNA(Ile)-lysidine synthase